MWPLLMKLFLLVFAAYAAGILQEVVVAVDDAAVVWFTGVQGY